MSKKLLLHSDPSAATCRGNSEGCNRGGAVQRVLWTSQNLWAWPQPASFFVKKLHTCRRPCLHFCPLHFPSLKSRQIDLPSGPRHQHSPPRVEVEAPLHQCLDHPLDASSVLHPRLPPPLLHWPRRRPCGLRKATTRPPLLQKLGQLHQKFFLTAFVPPTEFDCLHLPASNPKESACPLAAVPLWISRRRGIPVYNPNCSTGCCLYDPQSSRHRHSHGARFPEDSSIP